MSAAPPPLHVAFDARMVHHSGIGTHIRGLVEAMAAVVRRDPGPAPRFTFLGDPAVLARYPSFGALGETRAATMPVYGPREQLAFPRVRGASLCHFPHYNVPVTQRGPFVVTIHDLIHLLFPGYVPSRAKRVLGGVVLRRAARRARVILTVSEATRDDIVHHLGVDPARIRVIPNAVSAAFASPSPDAVDATRRRLGLTGDYLLAAGVDKPHKNFVFLADAFARWRGRTGADVRLVICGPRRADGPVARHVAAHAPEGVRILEYQDHPVMPQLMAGARALVFPSLYEGFGLPILEAQRVGTPVICSRASCMPWVAGEGALYFDPSDADELAARLDELFGSPDTAARLVAAGRGNEARFHWEDAARETLRAYADACRT